MTQLQIEQKLLILERCIEEIAEWANLSKVGEFFLCKNPPLLNLESGTIVRNNLGCCLCIDDTSHAHKGLYWGTDRSSERVGHICNNIRIDTVELEFKRVINLI